MHALGKDRVEVIYFYDDSFGEEGKNSAKLVADWLGLSLPMVHIESVMGKKITRSSFMKILGKSLTLNRFLQNIYCLCFGETPFMTTMRKEEFRTNWFRRSIYDCLAKDLEILFDGWFTEIRRYVDGVAENTNTIILGGGNYTEVLSGWFTKGGLDDMPYSPIGKLYKTQVNQLAEYLEIPTEIRNRVSSADVLWSTPDELALGISYDKLDTILYGIEKGFNDRNIMGYAVTKRDIKKVRKMNHLAIRKKQS